MQQAVASPSGKVVPLWLLLILAGCLPDLFFYHEYGSGTFLRNASNLVPDYTASHPKSQYLISVTVVPFTAASSQLFSSPHNVQGSAVFVSTTITNMLTPPSVRSLPTPVHCRICVVIVCVVIAGLYLSSTSVAVWRGSPFLGTSVLYVRSRCDTCQHTSFGCILQL